MSAANLIDPDFPAEIRSGRRFPYATVGDYVALSGVSDRACRVYWLLRMHVNGKRGDDAAWPSQRTLADMLVLKKTDTIGAAIRELVELGAVEVETVPTAKGRANIYTVHEAPPQEYAGFSGLLEFYEARESAGQQGSPPAEGAPPNRRRIGGRTPGQRGSSPSEGSPLSEGGGHPSPGGDGSPLSGGSESPEEEQPEGRGDGAGQREERPVVDGAGSGNAPHPSNPVKANPADRSTWHCAEHLAVRIADPGADIPPCRRCASVREWCLRKLVEAAETEVDRQRFEAERAEACSWCNGEGDVLDPLDGQPFDPVVRCDHSTTSPEVARRLTEEHQARQAARAAEVDRCADGARALPEKFRPTRLATGTPAPARSRQTRPAGEVRAEEAADELSQPSESPSAAPSERLSA